MKGKHKNLFEAVKVLKFLKPESLRPVSLFRRSIFMFLCFLLLSFSVFSELFVLFVLPASASTQEARSEKQVAAPASNSTKTLIPKKTAIARRVNPHPPAIDGRLNDAAWQDGEWFSDFIQFDPEEGQPPSELTAFKVVYDDSHLYLAIHCFDSQPGSIERRLSRRDSLSGDYLLVFLDSLYDQRTSYCFAVNAAGVKADQLLFNDGFDENTVDLSWDPIWEVKVATEAEGWTAEMKIPFSQLRFGRRQEQIWGLQVMRELFRKNEVSLWQRILKNAPGWTSQFGELRGVTAIKPPRQVELLPYAVGSLRNYPRQDGNPLATGHDNRLFGGLDGKVGLTHDLTVNFTLNPDFGQVEADPSVINLTAYETYFEEKRPFFVEGRNITDFKITSGSGDFSFDNLFYSRRLGREPQIYPETSGYYRLPQSTTILGALKLSGKTKNGWSIGLIEALTDKEQASIYLPESGTYDKSLAEPLSNYLTFRLAKDYRQGATVVGVMFTGVNRQLDDETDNLLHRSAYSGGFDFYHSWKDRQYYVSLKAVGSGVHGTPEAIRLTQESPVHYFQRPDADYLTYDPDRRALYGQGGSIDFGRAGGSDLLFSTGFTWRSPGLELNDAGYLRAADSSMQYFWAGYRLHKPFSIFRNLQLNLNQWTGWNFGGEKTFAGGNINGWAEFKNYWTFNFGLNRQFTGLSTSALRGGPLLRNAPGFGFWGSIQTDMRRKLRLSVYGDWTKAFNGDRLSYSFGPKITYVPMSAFNLSLAPDYSYYRNELQYVDSVVEAGSGGAKKYIVGKIDQKTISLTARFNLSLTPDLSVQFYGMPFISAGKYDRFKLITEPRAKDWEDRYQLFGESQLKYEAGEKIYSVDENGDGETDYSFANPDFNFLQFRANLVLRWEYRPGCTLFLVWSQGRTEAGQNGVMDFNRDIDRLFSSHPDNVFLIKLSYCLY